LSAVRRILKYVNGTPTFELYYTKDTDNRLKGYCAADWAGSLDDIWGSLGGCYFVGNNMVSWKSMKQNNLPLSTAEVELSTLENSSSQLVRLKQLTEECGISLIFQYYIAIIIVPYIIFKNLLGSLVQCT